MPKGHPESIVGTPRRSPRFLRANKPLTDVVTSHKPEPKRNEAHVCDRILRSSTLKGSSHNRNKGEDSPVVISSSCLRRSARLSAKFDGFVEKSTFGKFNRKGASIRAEAPREIGLAKRVTRSASSRSISRFDEGTYNDEGCDGYVRRRVKACEGKANRHGCASKKSNNATAKGIVSKSNRANKVNSSGNEVVECTSTKFLNRNALLNEERTEVGVGLSDDSTKKAGKRSRCEVVTSKEVVDGGGGKRGDLDEGKNRVRIKSKKEQSDTDNRIVHGWTKDQELALQRAYFAAEPTPHFWKKVARMVPGKSAQECFDKVHSDHVTPPQPRLRSRAKRMEPSSLSLSASKLLDTEGSTINKQRCKKQKSYLAQKAARQLLEKLYNVDQDCEADLFNVLEPTAEPPNKAVQQHKLFSTPNRSLEGPNFLQICQGRSSLANKKYLSRVNSSSGTTLISPPVLKQIKNKALHERYIDQLHCREAKRKAYSLRKTRCTSEKRHKEGHNKKVDAVKAAKNALLLDARDAITKLQHLQANSLNDLDNDDRDDCAISDNDEATFSGIGRFEY